MSSKMSRREFQDLVRETFAGLQKLTEGKGAEYAGEQVHKNEHANFDRLAVDLDLRPEKVLWVYLKKHLDSILTWVNNPYPKGYVPSEPIAGRIDDAILYLLLLKGMHRRGLREPEIDMEVAKAVVRQPGQWIVDEHGPSQPVYGPSQPKYESPFDPTQFDPQRDAHKPYDLRSL